MNKWFLYKYAISYVKQLESLSSIIFLVKKKSTLKIAKILIWGYVLGKSHKIIVMRLTGWRN